LGCLCGATAFLALLLSIAPAISYKLQNGPNSSVAERLVGESDIYGLKISTMLLPSTFHPIAALRKEKQTYVLSFPSLLANESEQATLGCFGVFGF